MSARFPWNVVKGWLVTSRADGAILVTPSYVNGTPGVFTRMALARWIESRLTKRGERAASTSTAAQAQGGSTASEATVAPQQK